MPRIGGRECAAEPSAYRRLAAALFEAGATPLRRASSAAENIGPCDGRPAKKKPALALLALLLLLPLTPLPRAAAFSWHASAKQYGHRLLLSCLGAPQSQHERAGGPKHNSHIVWSQPSEPKSASRARHRRSCSLAGAAVTAALAATTTAPAQPATNGRAGAPREGLSTRARRPSRPPARPGATCAIGVGAGAVLLLLPRRRRGAQ
eukprot:scaffold2804_cov371-Prasinococcus_capsulatus_cf.AAC.6